MSPSNAIFFAWTGAEHPLSVDWCGASLALAWSPKNGEVFQIRRPPTIHFFKSAETKILVLLSALVEIFGLSFMRIFFLYISVTNVMNFVLQNKLSMKSYRHI